MLTIAQAERIAQKYLAAQEGSHTLLAQDPKSLTLRFEHNEVRLDAAYDATRRNDGIVMRVPVSCEKHFPLSDWLNSAFGLCNIRLLVRAV